MSLCTLAQVKAFLGIATADEDNDDLLTSFIERTSSRLAGEAGRVLGGVACLERAAHVELFSPQPRTQVLWAAAWPMVSITEIKEALYGAFDDVDALVANEGYQVLLATGQLMRIGRWMAGAASVRVTYTGGYTPPTEFLADGYEQGAGEVLLPPAVTEAAVQQVAFSFNRRDELGQTSAGVQGGSFSTYAKDELLPNVRQVMAMYRRLL